MRDITSKDIYEKLTNLVQDFSRDELGRVDEEYIFINYNIYDSLQCSDIPKLNDDDMQKLCDYVYKMYYDLQGNYNIDEITKVIVDLFNQDLDLDRILLIGATSFETYLDK